MKNVLGYIELGQQAGATIQTEVHICLLSGCAPECSSCWMLPAAMGKARALQSM